MKNFIQLEIMDTEGNQLAVDDLIIFNRDSDFYRTHYIVGWVTKISAAGSINLDVIKVERLTTYAGYQLTIPNYEDIVGRSRLIPKRGREAGPGNYRYEKHDVYVSRYDTNKTYLEPDYDWTITDVCYNFELYLLPTNCVYN